MQKTAKYILDDETREGAKSRIMPDMAIMGGATGLLAGGLSSAIAGSGIPLSTRLALTLLSGGIGAGVGALTSIPLKSRLEASKPLYGIEAAMYANSVHDRRRAMGYGALYNAAPMVASALARAVTQNPAVTDTLVPSVVGAGTMAATYKDYSRGLEDHATKVGHSMQKTAQQLAYEVIIKTAEESFWQKYKTPLMVGGGLLAAGGIGMGLRKIRGISKATQMMDAQNTKTLKNMSGSLDRSKGHLDDLNAVIAKGDDATASLRSGVSPKTPSTDGLLRSTQEVDNYMMGSGVGAGLDPNSLRVNF